ncbi:MAG: arsenate reductase ArsC [Methanobacteriaceae archaeon]|jgi:arsenate reductase|nr:arsenate reductase ArsC [Methanobacteriaceae archaeon]MDO9628161.1 arsenate reductase ArsC [Methanobacteriaceae archaeon]
MESNKKKVIFICKNNSGRSQLAEALLKNTYSNHYEVYSAGSEPLEINPLTIEVLREIGIDISQNKSKSLEKFQGHEFDYVVSLCDEGACPVFIGGKSHIHQGFPDPREFKGDDNTQLNSLRNLRDNIQEWIKKEFSREI